MAEKAITSARFTKRSEKAGLPPGTTAYVGRKKVEKVRISLIDYDDQGMREREVDSVEECFPFRDRPTVTWINVEGLHEVGVVEALCRAFSVHPLVIEDILNTHQRPKIDVFDEYVFAVVRMNACDGQSHEIVSEQLSIILGDNFVLTFQEMRGDIFDPLRDRIRQNRGRIRKVGADYLAYAMLDAVVDSYFGILEEAGEEIEDLEEELMEAPTPETLGEIHSLKRRMIFLRKSVWPLRELIIRMQRGETPLVRETTQIYLRDLYDHTIQVIDTVETLRDIIAGMLDIYLSSISNRMNEVMKVLTIFASIFIPLTFITGVYGMNFTYMPELQWRWGYFGSLGLMAAVGVALLIFFRRKKWL